MVILLHLIQTKTVSSKSQFGLSLAVKRVSAIGLQIAAE